MDQGHFAHFASTADDGVVNFDLHGDASGQNVSYDQGRAVPDLSGHLVAAFTGNHGRFRRNRSTAPVTVTVTVTVALQTGGDCRNLRIPRRRFTVAASTSAARASMPRPEQP